MKAIFIIFTVYLHLSFGYRLRTRSLLIETENSPAEDVSTSTISEQPSPPAPKIYSMNIISNITNRYVITEVTSNVKNPATKAAEVIFSVVLPKQAFISAFVMEIGDKSYKAYVKEKEEAQKIYDQAVSSGSGAGLVAYNPRETDTFTVSANVEPESKVVFKLKYEELLRRQIGQYEHVININPGQIVDDLNVEVNVSESRPLKFVRTPSLRSGNEIDKNDETATNPSTDIISLDSTSTLVKFKPTKEEQEGFASKLGNAKEFGIKGQFIVQYDVERDNRGGEILLKDGYFVHFFTKEDLEPLPKHVVFVLDYSGSMSGRKIDQVIESIQNILSDLNEQDTFHIVKFSSHTSVWDLNRNNSFQLVDIGGANKKYGELEMWLKEAHLPEAAKATKENVENAKIAIQNSKKDMYLTNMIEGLEVGLFLVKKTKEIQKDLQLQPLVIFLTDGFPTTLNQDEIVKIVRKVNENIGAPIYALSFGDNASKEFLKKLSTQNHGFSRHIYEASDAALQLESFYSQISNPLLDNVTFKYVDQATEVTETHYPLYFKGSELVIAGKVPRSLQADEFTSSCTATTINAQVLLPVLIVQPIGPLERLWAYLTVQQILDKRDVTENKETLTKDALELALKYSFVTPVTSLVVVKPNKTITANPAEPENGLKFENHAGSVALLPSISAFNSRVPGHPISSAAFPGMLPGPPGPPGQSFHQGRPLLAYPLGRPSGYPTTTYVTPSTTISILHKRSLPQWVQDVKDNGGNVITPTGNFTLGVIENVTSFETCPTTPFDGSSGKRTEGRCTVIEDCPVVFNLLVDFQTYLPYLCPIENKYAGVCCPLLVES